jgi:hypothetical protein
MAGKKNSGTPFRLPSWEGASRTAFRRVPSQKYPCLLSCQVLTHSLWHYYLVLWSLMLFRPISHCIFLFLSSSPHPTYVRWPLAKHRGALERAVSSNHSLAVLFPSVQTVTRPLFPIGSRASPNPDPIPHCSGQGFCLGWLVPISQTNSTCLAYSSPWWWRQQGPLKR